MLLAKELHKIIKMQYFTGNKQLLKEMKTQKKLYKY